MLTLESNRYRQQVGRSRSTITSVQEMRIFVGVSLPVRRMYWSPKTRVAAVADLMLLNRFEQILSLLHANDNELMKKKGEQGSGEASPTVYSCYVNFFELMVCKNNQFLKK